MSLPYPSMVFVPLDILTAEEMNQLVSNIESLSAGTGLADGAITSDKIDWTTLEEYSTSERCIGKWVNNKPLYQKVVQTTMPSGVVDTVTSTFQIPFSSVGLSNIDLIFVNWLILADGTTQSAWVLNNTAYFVRAGAIKSQSYLYTQTNRSSLSDAVTYIVVRYTKTTD